MNILTVSEDCFPQIGGIATHVEGLSRALLREGHGVHVLTRRRDVPNIRNLVVAARRWVHGDIPVTALPIVYSPKDVLRRFQYATRFAREAARIARREGVQVVTFHHFLEDPEIVRPLRRRLPIVFTNHSSQFLAGLAAGERERLRRRFDFASAVIAPSRELAEATIAVGYPAERTHYVPNGVDERVFRPDPGARGAVCRELGLDPARPIVLCARSPFEKNGVIYFVRALARLPGRIPCSVVFAGLSGEPEPDEFAYTTELRDAARALPEWIAVRMLGAVPNDRMPRLHAAADLAVLPSLMEATSIAGLESMAAGLPIVGTRVGGIPEIVDDGRTGLLVPPRDAEALAAALDALLGDGARRRAMGDAARRRVETEFSWSAIARRTVEVYRGVVDGWGAPAAADRPSAPRRRAVVAS